jgi:REP element-mobilizing transposase RayT
MMALQPVSDRAVHAKEAYMERLRIEEGAALWYLTFSVIQWLPVFVSEEPCLIVTESLNYCHREKHLRTSEFVIMPTHLHLIVMDADFDLERLRHTLTDMRKFTGRRLADYCEQTMPPAFRHVIQGTRRTDRSRQFWQQSRHPEGIYTRKFWKSKVDYVRDNPRRKGFVRDPTTWRFSSAGYWLLDPPAESDVVLTAVEW